MFEHIKLGDIAVINAITTVWPDKGLFEFDGLTYFEILKLIDKEDKYMIFWSSYDLKHAKSIIFNVD